MATVTQQRTQIAAYLRAFDFRKLFIEELGWDRYRGTLQVQTKGGATYTLEGVAEKRGVVALVCGPDARGGVPDYATRKLIEDLVVKSVREHLIIFTDERQNQQCWLWTKREQGQRPQYRGEWFFKGQSGERLVQKLQEIVIPLASEEDLTLLDVTTRLEQGFDVERITKKFYDRFQKEHEVFVQAINGIADPELQRWYASLMLNRLMFTYFIQRKGFLDGDTNYLPHRLARVRALGPDKFHSFYRGFLLRLFHDGLGKPPAARQLDPELARLIGNVPYLNGGLFEVHQIESGNRAIAIPDSAFERIFAFFDEYDWYLDDRPLRNDKEINPDVLGYIFEKYINQKQMGAYYTKEDITGYISRNTVLPFLFDQAREKCKVAFEPGGEVWRLLQDDPDRYIYEAVRRGVDEPLPQEIAAGVHDIAKRGGWNRPAPEPFALPTETWREHVARRTRCLELRRKLARGEVTAVNDLITYNLDIERLARDVIERCEGPEVLRAFWQAITSATILDPTCGSGAFLFAALNILKPLYEACLDRMQAFVDDFDRLGERQKGPDFRKELERVQQHPKREYYVLKSIIIGNLYGVDIMAEACEIAKLRLFLTLVAQVEEAAKLEPLPDIDFNIRAGNTLVGFTTLDAVRQAMTFDTAGRTRKLLLDPRDEEALKRIDEQAEIAGRAYQQFQRMQSEHGMDAAAVHAAKDELRRRLDALREELDRYLAREYGISAEDDLFAFVPWRAKHQPLHWFVEFYGIVQGHGGFDVIIGNPPYVVYSESAVSYQIRPDVFQTFPAKNLYAYTVERATHLANALSRIGFIVQLTALSSERMQRLQDVLLARGRLYALPFPRRPESIFDGVEMPVAILLSSPLSRASFVTSNVNRFYTEERPEALTRTRLLEHELRAQSYRIAKIGSLAERHIYTKLIAQSSYLAQFCITLSQHILYYQEACRYWVKACKGLPYFRKNGVETSPPHGRTIALCDDEAASFAACLANSSLFYWYYSVLSDCEHINDILIRNFPVPLTWRETSWLSLAQQLSTSLAKNARRKTIYTKQGHTIEYDEIRALHSKPIIDEIDRVLARHYGFTDEELDFIINYDIKYRVGQENGDDGEESGQE